MEDALKQLGRGLECLCSGERALLPASQWVRVQLGRSGADVKKCQAHACARERARVCSSLNNTTRSKKKKKS